MKGTLALSGAGSIATSSALTIQQNTTFDTRAATGNPSVTNLSGQGNIRLPPATNTLTVSQGTAFSGTVSGVISGAGALTKSGLGVLSLSGNNTYTGATNVASGTMSLTGFGSIAASSSLTIAAGATFSTCLKTDDVILNSLYGGGTFYFRLGQTLTLIHGGDFPGALLGQEERNEVRMVVRGVIPLNLSGASSLTGRTLIAGSTLALSGSGSTSSGPGAGSSSTTLSGTGATLDLSAQTIDTYLNSLLGDPGSLILLSTNPTSLPTAPNLIVTQLEPLTFAGTMEANGGIGGLTVNGPSTLTLSGNNNYKGPTVINADPVVGTGTLALSGSGTIAPSTSLTINAGAALDLSLSAIDTYVGPLSGAAGSTILLSTNPTSLPAAPSLEVTQSSPEAFAGVILGNGGNGGLTIVGPSTLTLSGTNTYAGPTAVNADPVVHTGTLALSGIGSISNSSSLTLGVNARLDLSATTIGTIVNNLSGEVESTILLAPSLLFTPELVATQTSPGTFAGQLQGVGGLTVLGTSTLTLSGENTYAGPTTVAGIATLALSGGSGSISSSPLTVNAGTLLDISQTTLGATVYDLSGAGNVNMGRQTLIVLQPDPGLFSGVISGEGGTLIKSGSSTLTLSGINTYTGPTIVSSGTLVLSGSGSIAASASLTIEPGATFICSSATINPPILSGTPTFIVADPVPSLSGSGTIDVMPQHILTVNQTSPGVFSGVIQGAGGMEVLGTSILTLTGINTYTGPTTVNGPAKLALQGSDSFIAISNSSSLTL